ncbi:MAG: glucose-6-phosphate dehydrogenase [Betaproteobacteria bacterium]|nr:glucose-6-phosphate dehydrogenase [Betaproteobacteria bacterium]
MTQGDATQLVQILIFGGRGDLARRKLVPAIASLARRPQGGAQLQVVGIGRSGMSDDAFRAWLRGFPQQGHAEAFDAIAPQVHYRSADVQDLASLRKLRAEVDALAGGAEVARLCYLALEPRLFASAVTLLSESGIVHRHRSEDRGYRRVIIEKPFGHDLASAHALNEAVQRVLNEHQVLRIDHYLGKETVQNLLGFRFHNAIFEPVWNRHHVELVQITVAETLGVEEGRAAYYDGTGALRDVLQNHMLQVLALVAMEPPASLDAEALRNQKVEVLRALRLPDPEEIARSSVRARYGPGAAQRGYLDEVGVAEDSTTETYVALRAEINNWRWRGVPFLLRHGKRLPKRFTEVQVQFRMPPLQLFNRPPDMSDAEFDRALHNGALCLIRPNVLTIGIQPRETIGLSFGVKQPGPEMIMAPAALAFDYRERFDDAPPDAYERLLQDAIAGDATLFLRSDEIEASWRYCDAVRTAWSEHGAVPLHEYPAGTWGPAAADELFRGCEGGWTRG